VLATPYRHKRADAQTQQPLAAAAGASLCAMRRASSAAALGDAAASGHVIDLTADDDDDAAARAARRAARKRRRQSAPSHADVIDLSTDEPAQQRGGGAGGSGAAAVPFTCSICFCDYDSVAEEGQRFFACGHVFCVGCAKGHVTAQLEQGLPDAKGILCPTLDCRTPLSLPDVSAAAGAAAARRFDELMMGKLLQQNPEHLGCATHSCLWFWALKLTLTLMLTLTQRSCCPTPGCPFLFEWDAANRKLDCPLCKKRYCVFCKVRALRCKPRSAPASADAPALCTPRAQCDWHTGMRCEERAAGSADDAAFLALARKGRFKSCPSCKCWVEKADGCDGMTCRCGAHFCYRCGSGLRASHGAQPRCCCAAVARFLR
jgi:hypothetical protein